MASTKTHVLDIVLGSLPVAIVLIYSDAATLPHDSLKTQIYCDHSVLSQVILSAWSALYPNIYMACSLNP